MFQWAQQQMDKISQTVAPPPTDGAGRFAYCTQRRDEDAAMGCIAEIDPVHTVVNQSKGWYPIHLACQCSLIRLIRLLMSQPGIQIGHLDSEGNTPLHHACTSTQPEAMDCVKMLVTEYGASCVVKNSQGQTPYDVATVNSIRQYLLPIQLQAETQIALDNGGQGLPPGIDLGGLRIKNSAMPPPPTGFASPPGGAGPHPPMGGAPPQPMSHPGGTAASMQPTAGAGAPPPPHAQGFGSTHHAVSAPAPAAFAPPIPAPMSAGGGGYSRVGSSSAQLTGASKYRADGFHSSSSDVGLQKKYGHAQVQRYVPPPPSSGGSIPSAPSSGNGGPNPFAGGAAIGANRYGTLPNANRRYVAYGPGATSPAPASQPVYPTFAPQATPMPANVTMFTPPGAASQASSAYPTATPAAVSPYAPSQSQNPPYVAPAPVSQPYGAPAPTPSTPNTPYMPPPPYQTQQYQQTGATPPTSQPASAYQRPDFVSPAAATYGSPSTPSMETPVGGTPANGSAANASNMADATAGNVFGQPSPQKEQPTNANDAFAAPAPAPQPAVAETVFGGAPPPVEAYQPLKLAPAPGVSPFAAATPHSISRAMSAEELFAEDAPVESASQTQAFETSNEETTPPPAVEQQPMAVPTETPAPTDAATVFRSSPLATDADEDGMLDDVPLSPGGDKPTVDAASQVQAPSDGKI